MAHGGGDETWSHCFSGGSGDSTRFAVPRVVQLALKFAF
jgi:hypothetical protein